MSSELSVADSDDRLRNPFEAAQPLRSAGLLTGVTGGVDAAGAAGGGATPCGGGATPIGGGGTEPIGGGGFNPFGGGGFDGGAEPFGGGGAFGGCDEAFGRPEKKP